MIKFLPIEQMIKRVESSKDDSDVAYFYDLLLLGEQLTKIITLFLISNINEDKDRHKYRQEYGIIRANAIGDYARILDDILTGTTSSFISSAISDYELQELTIKVKKNESWQYKPLILIKDCLQMFHVDSEKLPLKAPLRLWFNYFTLLRNKTKGHGAPKITSCSNVSTKLYESILIIIDNFSAFKRPWAFLHRNLSGKYKISLLTETTKHFDHLKRKNSFNYDNGIYCFIDSIRKINLFYSTPELIDFYYPNGNFRTEKFETISYVSDQRIFQSATKYLQPITSLPASYTEGFSSLQVIGNCFTNLPFQTDNYILRNSLENELQEILLAEDRYPVVTLKGRGGIGKTSLAINVLHKIAITKRFDLIIWFSARDIDLMIEGPKQVKTKVLNQNDIATEYCNLVEKKLKSKEKIEYFSNQLTKNENGKTLFIFDNFETITNPLEVFNWINTFIRNPNKVLITSRMTRNFKADYPIEVGGMNENECCELIDLFVRKFSISNLIDEKYKDELVNESDGHPYILKILLGDIAKSKEKKKIRRIISESDNILNALFQRTFHELSPAAKRVFLTLCSWNSMIPKVALEAVLWRPENEKIDVESAITELHKSSFIDLINESNDTFINVPLAALIFGKAELKISPAKLKILEDRELLIEFGSSKSNNIRDGVAPLIERKFKNVARRISNIDDFRKEQTTLEFIASKFPKAWIFIAKIYEEYNELEKSKYAIREFLKQSPLIKNKEKYLFKLANMCRSTNDWEGESSALVDIALIPKISYDIISSCANRINSFFHHNVDRTEIEYKETIISKIIDVLIERIDEAEAIDFSRLAWLLLNTNNKEKALFYIEEGLKLDKDNEHCLRLYDKLNSY